MTRRPDTLPGPRTAVERSAAAIRMMDKSAVRSARLGSEGLLRRQLIAGQHVLTPDMSHLMADFVGLNRSEVKPGIGRVVIPQQENANG